MKLYINICLITAVQECVWMNVNCVSECMNEIMLSYTLSQFQRWPVLCLSFLFHCTKGCSRKKCKGGHRLKAYLSLGRRDANIIELRGRGPIYLNLGGGGKLFDILFGGREVGFEFGDWTWKMGGDIFKFVQAVTCPPHVFSCTLKSLLACSRGYLFLRLV